MFFSFLYYNLQYARGCVSLVMKPTSHMNIFIYKFQGFLALIGPAFIVLLRQQSDVIKNQLRHTKPPTRSLSACITDMKIFKFRRHSPVCRDKYGWLVLADTMESRERSPPVCIPGDRSDSVNLQR